MALSLRAQKAEALFRARNSDFELEKLHSSLDPTSGPCPCCGIPSYPTGYVWGQYDICHFCHWEDDPGDYQCEDISGSNHENFWQFSEARIVAKHLIADARERGFEFGWVSFDEVDGLYNGPDYFKANNRHLRESS